MVLTGKAKEDFEKWLPQSGYILFGPELGYEVILYALSIEWFDSVGIYIMSEPYLGGGQPVFYFKVIYRNEDYVDTWYDSADDDIYFGYRPEAIQQAIIKANEIYNSL